MFEFCQGGGKANVFSLVRLMDSLTDKSGSQKKSYNILMEFFFGKKTLLVFCLFIDNFQKIDQSQFFL